MDNFNYIEYLKNNPLLNESNTYSQLEFTAKGQLLSNFLNSDSGKNEDYHLNTRDENIIQDIGMYIDELYGDNKFTSLDVFALDIASQEYQDPQKGAINVLRKIKTAINKGWISVVPYKGDLSKDKVDPNKFWLNPEPELVGGDEDDNSESNTSSEEYEKLEILNNKRLELMDKIHNFIKDSKFKDNIKVKKEFEKINKEYKDIFYSYNGLKNTPAEKFILLDKNIIKNYENLIKNNI